MSHYEIRDKARGRKLGRLHDTREEAIRAAAEIVAGGGSVRIWSIRKSPPRYVALVAWTGVGREPRIERF